MGEVWIIAPFSGIDSVGVRNRFQYLSNRLHKEGISITLFTSKFNHTKKNHVTDKIAEQYLYPVEVINELGYTRNVSIKRVLSHITFTINMNKIINQKEKPSLIYCAYPTMSAAYLVGRYARKNNIPFILDIQDTWPESISAAIDTSKIRARIILWPFTRFADRIYKMADVVFGVSKTYARRANVKGSKCKEFIAVYIGAELDQFNKISTIEISKADEEIWITYIGTLSYSYDIETAIRAFSNLKEYKNIKLNILGTGPDYERLIELSKLLGVYDSTVIFFGYLEYEKMVEILKKSDVALNAITSGSKGTITNKLGDYLAAGLPILNSCKEQEVIDLVIKKQVGLNYIPGDFSSLKESILNMVSDPEKMDMYSKNARILSEQYFDRKESYKRIVEKIKEMCNIEK